MRLNVGCGTHYAEGWTNTDAVSIEGTRPDLCATGPRFPFADDAFEAVYLGHLLEHVYWQEVPALLAEVRRVLQPGCPVLATGPDVYRTIQCWADGNAPWWLVQDVLEHQDRLMEHWPEAVHKWNCHEARLAGALTAAGFEGVAPTGEFDGWPVVNWSAWQCAVRAVA